MTNDDMENFYSVLYEFDSRVTDMIDILDKADRKDLPLKDQNLINHYEMLLRELTKAYNAIDSNLSEKFIVCS